ncbi:MAG: gliding motility-associated C-terminal domain-containing protein [Bacteroidia bacterium]|nr:gliding motility-associated C-terminal domain-containing protein [Bacteroidia bacterium]
MRQYYSYIFIFLLFSLQGVSQVFWTEDFGTGCNQGTLVTSFTGLNGIWTQSNTGTTDAQANAFYVSSTEANTGVGNCGDGCLNNALLTNATLHIGSVAASPNLSAACPLGDCGALFDDGGVCPGTACVTTHIRAESPVIDCSGKSTVIISFNYFEGGSIISDNARLWYNDGTSWTMIFDMPKTSNCSPAGNWTALSFSLPVRANNNSNVRVGLEWFNNDDGIGTLPSFAVDDVQLSASAPSAPVADFTANNDTVCAKDSIQFTDQTTNSPTAWTWSSNPATGVSFNTSSSQNTSVTFSSAGTFTVQLIAANATASDTDTMVVTILPLPTITATTAAGFNDSICFGDTTQLSASGALSYSWNMNEGISDSTIFNPVFDSTLSSTYIVIGTDINGCKNSDTITITVLPLPVVTATTPFTLCSGDSVNFLASGATNYVWNTQTFLTDSLIANPVCTPTTSQNYTVTGSTTFGCSDTATVSVTVNPSSTAAGTAGSVPFGIPASINFTSTSTNIDSVVWNFGDGSATDTTTNPTHSFTSAGTFTVTLIAYNATGCNDTTTFVITTSAASSLVMPNFFSPNFDDVNDIFRPANNGIKDFYCVIYDRWGLKIYEWNRPQGWWDGYTTAGMLCPVGVYYFIMKATGEDGQEYEEKGYVHLFR